MGTIYFIFLVLLLVVGFVLMFAEAVEGFWCAALALVLLLSPIGLHTEDVVKVKEGHRLVEIQEEKVNSLIRIIGDVDRKCTALMNADTPVAYAIKSLTEAEKELAAEKTSIAEAHLRIEERKIGLTSFVLWFF